MKFLKEQLKKFIRTIAKTTTNYAPIVHARNLDPYLYLLLKDFEGKQNLNDPEFFVRELRASFMPYPLKVKEIKSTKHGSDEYNLRFSALLATFTDSLPCLPAPIACETVKTADKHLGNTAYVPAWGADLAWGLRKGSSFAKRGRILYNTVRFMRPTRCVEAGTFYGMSAFYILLALARYCEQGRLSTIEVSDVLYSVSSEALKARFGDVVTCYHGRTQDALPQILSEPGEIDFFFHDNGHSRDDYVRDFGLVLDALSNGSVVLYDDIRWKPPGNVKVDPRCYEGWLEVVSHPRVRRAAEISAEMGLILIS